MVLARKFVIPVETKEITMLVSAKGLVIYMESVVVVLANRTGAGKLGNNTAWAFWCWRLLSLS